MSIAIDRDQAFLSAIRRIADEVAAPNADEVDRLARFPSEAIDALREERALSAFVPEALGGGGVSFEAIATACYELGRRCGATAMVFAMHQIQIACVVRHLDGAPWFETWLRDVASEQRLVASVTSEVGTGGDLGRSIAAVTPRERHPRHVREAGADRLVRGLRRRPAHDAAAHARCRTRRPGGGPHEQGPGDPRADRDLGPPRACAARARRATSSEPSSTPIRSCRPRSPRSRPNRWSRSRTCCGRTSGSASPPTRSIAPGRSSAPPRSSGRTRCRPRPCACRT